MDERHLEQAERLTECLVTAGISKAMTKQVRPVGFDGFCTACEIDEVPPERIDLGYYNCVACQSAKEGRGRFYSL